VLHDIWFLLIAVLWVGYFVLEGFDFGVGILLPFIGRNDVERRTLIAAIGPVWGRQRGLAPGRRRRHFRGIPALVRHAVQRLLPGTIPDSWWP